MPRCTSVVFPGNAFAPHLLTALVLALALLALPVFAPVARAGETDALFVNATTDEEHRAMMALVFSKNQLERKHPVTIFLNDRGVLLASTKHSDRFKEHQDLLAAMMEAGATVLVCPMCMKQYGVAEADLLPGLQVSNPDLTGAALFQDDTQTLTW